MTKPPKSDAATLSGWPSNSVAKSSNSVREKGSSHKAFAVNNPPRIAVPLPPNPRIAGIPFVKTIAALSVYAQISRKPNLRLGKQYCFRR